MRLDKFLKVSRLIKRRTIAKEACDGGRVLINDHVAKAGSTVKVGDILLLKFGQKELKVRVKELRETASSDQAQEMFEVLQ